MLIDHLHYFQALTIIDAQSFLGLHYYMMKPLTHVETVDSFKWLIETFLEAHGNKKPQTLFTDQAQAMAKALVEAMPETRRGLCTWHLMQNGIKHLGSLMKGESHFLTNFKKCMYECDQ